MKPEVVIKTNVGPKEDFTVTATVTPLTKESSEFEQNLERNKNIQEEVRQSPEFQEYEAGLQQIKQYSLKDLLNKSPEEKAEQIHQLHLKSIAWKSKELRELEEQCRKARQLHGGRPSFAPHKTIK